MNGSIYGIDLGTTFTSIAVAGEDALGRVSVLKVGEDGDAIESIVYLREDGGRVRAWIGARARDEHKAFEVQGRYVSMAKRLIGIDTGETSGWPVNVGPFALRPHHVSSLVLRKVAREVTRLRPHDPVQRVVVTHPHYFPDTMKEATRDAGTLAGLDVVDTLNEPSAAVLAYGVLQRDAPGRYLVFDLGGGTFDVTVVEIGESRIRVLAGGGDPRLGGFEWDQRLLEHFNTEFRKVHPAFDLWGRATEQTVHEWREAAVRMKHQLSVSDVARARLIADVDGEPAKTAVEVTRAAFEGMTSTLSERALSLCEEVLARHGSSWSDLRDVLLVGGSTRMPMVRERVARALGRAPRVEGFDPATIVAQGAAHYARYYARAGREVALETVDGADARTRSTSEVSAGVSLPDVIDALARGFGVGAFRGQRLVVDVLLPPDTPVPAKRERTYHTMVDGQTEIVVPLFEGESETPEACATIGRVVLKGIPARPRGQPVRVVFEVERSGRKRVRLVDVGSGREVEQSIERSEESHRPLAGLRESLSRIEVV